jgi:hypothetical protein
MSDGAETGSWTAHPAEPINWTLAQSNLRSGERLELARLTLSAINGSLIQVHIDSDPHEVGTTSSAQLLLEERGGVGDRLVRNA